MADHSQSGSTINPALKQKRWWGGVLIFLGGMMIVIGIGYALLNIIGDLLPVFLGVIFAYMGVCILN